MSDLQQLAAVAVVTAVVTALVSGLVFRRRSSSDLLEVGAPSVPPPPAQAQPVTAPSLPPGEGYDLVLVSAGDRKIEVIKLVRAWTRYGLKEALDLVQAAPAVILTGLTSAQAADYVERLRRVGAAAEGRTNEKPLPETGGASER